MTTPRRIRVAICPMCGFEIPVPRETKEPEPAICENCYMFHDPRDLRVRSYLKDAPKDSQ